MKIFQNIRGWKRRELIKICKKFEKEANAVYSEIADKRYFDKIIMLEDRICHYVHDKRTDKKYFVVHRLPPHSYSFGWAVRIKIENGLYNVKNLMGIEA
ncbi:MAG: hypothetical protein ACTSPL_04260 [Candidatus Odinarchaeia archaeon]